MPPASWQKLIAMQKNIYNYWFCIFYIPDSVVDPNLFTPDPDPTFQAIPDPTH